MNSNKIEILSVNAVKNSIVYNAPRCQDTKFIL